MVKKYILVDGENTKPHEYCGIEKLTNKDTVILFDSIYCEGLLNWKLLYQIQNRPKKQRPCIKHYTVDRKKGNSANEKDKMDYYMIAHLTTLLKNNNNFIQKINKVFKNHYIEYCIISKDKGFDKYSSYFNDLCGIKLTRFGNFKELNKHYNKANVKKELKSNTVIETKKVNTQKTDISNEKIESLSIQMRNLTNLVNILIEKSNKESINNMYDVTEKTITSNLEDNTMVDNNKTLEKDFKITHNVDLNAFINDSNKEQTLSKTNSDSSNIIYLSDIKSSKIDDFIDEKECAIMSSLDISSVDNNLDLHKEIFTSKALNKFEKLGVHIFDTNYDNYPKKKKLLRDELFIKQVFFKHNLYSKYKPKSLDNFAKDCKNGRVNIKTVNNRIISSFSISAVFDFKPALDEIIKYQIEHNIM